MTLGSSASRPFAPLGSLGDDASGAAGGYVYVSHDAGATFSDITGNLPKVQATWVRQKGDQLVVSDAVGMFISKDLSGLSWAPLGSGFPTSPVYSFEFEPGDANKVVVASYGRGVWEYDFTKAGAQRCSTRRSRVATAPAAATTPRPKLATTILFGSAGSNSNE